MANPTVPPGKLNKGTIVRLGPPTMAVTAQAITATANGAIKPEYNYVTLNSATKIEATLAHAIPGKWLIISQIDANTAGHTVTLTGATWDGTNNTATFNAQYETLILRADNDKRWVIVLNLGSVGLSSV